MKLSSNKNRTKRSTMQIYYNSKEPIINFINPIKKPMFFKKKKKNGATARQNQKQTRRRGRQAAPEKNKKPCRKGRLTAPTKKTTKMQEPNTK